MSLFKTLTGGLDHAVDQDVKIGFIDGANDERRQSATLLKRAADRNLAVLQHAGLKRGDHLLLFIDDTLRFLQFFWAAIRGGIIPVPVAAGTGRAQRDKLLAIWDALNEPKVIVSAEQMATLHNKLEAAGSVNVAQRLADASIADQPPMPETPARPITPNPDDVALIQFSSGSTAAPKGVVLTHANVVANIHAIDTASEFQPEDVALSWMPLTHDMGLIGFHLTFLCLGHHHYLMRPDVFARRPRLWLEKAAEKQATILCAPNFGYRHTLRAISARGLPDIDLSAVRLIYNGAEPIVPALAREFVQTLAPTGLRASSLFAVYGLAEASLAVAFPAPQSGLETVWVDRRRLGVGERVELVEAHADNALELVRLGRTIGNTELALVSDGQSVAPGTVGQVWIRGDNVTAGYYANPEANADALQGDGWLDTGDLGFEYAGDLVITGRAKEVIFVNGQNLYPQDLESLAADAADVVADRVAAVGVQHEGVEGDALVVFAVHRGSVAEFVDTARRIATGLNEAVGVSVCYVLPINRLPKTTSGKIQRRQLALDFESGAFESEIAELDRLMPAAQDTHENDAEEDDAVSRLTAICREVAPDKQIGPADNLFEIGLSSLELAQIHEGIEADWPNRLEITDLFDYPTVNDLAAVLGRGA